MEKISEETIVAFGIKYTLNEDNKVIARATLYVMTNDLHNRPFGLLEDVYVEPGKREGGLGTRLVEQVIKEAKGKYNCYKLIATSRHERTMVHEWYKKLGFKNHGLEFRMDFE